MSDFDNLVNLVSNLDPLVKVVIISLVGFAIILFIIRRGRKRSSEPEKIVEPFIIKDQFKIDDLNRQVRELTANIQSEPPIEEIKVDSEGKPEVNYKSMYEKIMKKFIDLEKRYMNREIEFSSLKGRVDHWKQRCLRAEEINEGYGTDVSAIYKSKGDIKVSALEYLLAIVADTNSIEQGIKTINKPAYPKSVQLGSYIVFAMIIAFFWLNKDAWGQVMLFINTPRNQIFIVLALVSVAVITYYYKRKR